MNSNALRGLTVIMGMLLLASLVGIYVLHKNTGRNDYASKFNVTEQNIASDLDGKIVQLPYGQAWPFDPTQSIQVSVIAKKPTDDGVVVLALVKAFADVPKDGKHDKDSKDSKQDKDAKQLTKVRLEGFAKLTYEYIGSHWCLMGVDNVSMRASPND